MSITEFIQQANEWGQHRVPFFFMIDFEMEKPRCIRLSDLDSSILFDFNGVTHQKYTEGINISDAPLLFNKHPLPYHEYRGKFDSVYQRIQYGDSFLTNLTIKTPIEVNCTLRELYSRASAKYKLCYRDEFLFFSPETFVTIHDGKIFSYPMKGTIDATLNNARDIILDDKKEMAEHITIVDLIRNDLSRVASRVSVTKFRYIDEIHTNYKRLLQVSSEITGQLPDQFHQILGDILVALLPAGSICGAPKQKTIDIIQKTEGERRGYYTGIAGYFDGENLDSCVMIRFIENSQGVLYYRSGGGITSQSDPLAEYKEAIDKVYVPVN